MGARSQTNALRLPAAFWRAVALCGALLLLDLAGLCLIRQEWPRIVFSDIMAPLIDALAAVLLILAASRSFAHSRRMGIAWGAVAAAMLLYMLGDASWGVLEAGLKLAPFPSIADFFYLTYYIAFLLAIHLLLGRTEGPVEFAKDGIELAIVLTAAVLGFGNFLIGPIFPSYVGATPLALSLLAAYPVGDLVL